MINDNSFQVAILVHSCDRYELLYEGFTFFFDKHWDPNIKCNRYFATEEKSVDIKGFENIKSGKGEWADRLKFLLEKKISEPYVLYLQEDMWFNKKVNTDLLNELFSLFQKNNWVQLKLHSSEIYKTNPTEYYIEGYNISKLDNVNSDYLMSHQISLWDKEFLIKQLNKGEHPWRNERKATKRLKKINPDIYHVDCFAENGKPPINMNKEMIFRSSYYAVSTNGILNNFSTEFINELSSEKKFKDYSNILLHNLNNEITHDGLPRPKKTDFFKKLKSKFKDIFK